MTDALVKSDDKHSAVMQSLAVFTRSFSSHILSAVMALIHVTAVCSHSTLNAVHTTHCHDLYWSKNATSDCKDAKAQAKHHKSAKILHLAIKYGQTGMQARFDLKVYVLTQWDRLSLNVDTKEE